MHPHPGPWSPQPGPNRADPAGAPDGIDGLDGIETALEALADLPQSRHVEVFTDIHQRLTAALALTGGVQTQQTQQQTRQSQQQQTQQQQTRQGPPAPAGNREGPPNQQRGR